MLADAGSSRTHDHRIPRPVLNPLILPGSNLPHTAAAAVAVAVAAVEVVFKHFKIDFK